LESALTDDQELKERRTTIRSLAPDPRTRRDVRASTRAISDVLASIVLAIRFLAVLRRAISASI
jgi:hypothetical protein